MRLHRIIYGYQMVAGDQMYLGYGSRTAVLVMVKYKMIQGLSGDKKKNEIKK